MANKRKTQETISGYLFCLPALLLFLSVGLYSVIFSVFLSFYNWSGVDFAGTARLVGFGNFRYFLFGGSPINTRNFFLGLFNNFRIRFFTILFVIPVGLVLAYLVTNLKRSGVWRTIFFIPMVSSGVGIFYVWRGLFGAQGFLNTLFSNLGLDFLVVRQGMLGDPNTAIIGKKAVFMGYIALILVPGLAVQIPLYINMVALGMADTLPGLVLPIINGAGPFAVFLFRNYFASLSRDLLESAKIDGCKIFTIYAKIYMPLALPVIGTIAVLNFVSSWNGLQWPLIILRSRTWYTLPLAIMYLDQSAFTQWNVLMTGSMFSVVPVVAIFMMLQKSYVRGLTLGAIKG